MNALSSPNSNSATAVLDNHMSIQAAAKYSGYYLQYLRRLVRQGEVEGVKIGQVWLVNVASLDGYLKRVQNDLPPVPMQQRGVLPMQGR